MIAIPRNTRCSLSLILCGLPLLCSGFRARAVRAIGSDDVTQDEEGSEVPVSMVEQIGSRQQTTHSQCSGKVKGFSLFTGSCEKSWESTGRCTWQTRGKMCLPNCFHATNQNKAFCEANFCEWIESTKACTFDDRNETIRRDFCSNYKEELTSGQRSFCSGMITGGGVTDVSVARVEGWSPVKTMLWGMARCWKPNPQNKDSYQHPAVQQEMKAALDGELANLLAKKGNDALPLYPVTTFNPLRFFGSMGDYLPHHYSVLTTNKKLHLTSHCLEFDYDAQPAPPDPAGCGFFQRSFAPLKKLAKCVQPKIESDPYWHIWQKVNDWAPKAAADPEEEAQRFSSLVRATLGSRLSEAETDPALMKEALHERRECGDFTCVRMPTFHRAMEFLKLVELQSWYGLSVAHVEKSIREMVTKTATAPPTSNLPRLTANTVDAIVFDCFKISKEASSSSTSESTFPSAEVLMVHETLRCLPLMWDGSEVPGSPKSALWPTDWQPPVKESFKHTHPLCGRLALAGLVRQFSRSPYPSGMNLMLYSAKADVDDKYCLAPEMAQCKNFKQCFVRNMLEHMRNVHSRCEVFDVTDSTIRAEDVMVDEDEEDNLTCCCRPPEGVGPESPKGDCAGVKHIDMGMFGRRFYHLNDTTKEAQCCKLVDSSFGCLEHTRYDAKEIDMCPGWKSVIKA